MSKEWYTESRWNTVFWKMELGPVLINTSVSWRCEVENQVWVKLKVCPF